MLRSRCLGHDVVQVKKWSCAVPQVNMERALGGCPGAPPFPKLGPSKARQAAASSRLYSPSFSVIHTFSPTSPFHPVAH